MNTPASPMDAPVPGPSPSAEIAHDMVRRGAMVLPPVVAATALLVDGPTALSVGYGMAIIMANFLSSAYLLAGAARISLGLIPSVALGGYVMRLALVFMAVWLIRDTSWVRMVPLGITIIVTHLGLLVWELRHVSASVAHPGLKPRTGLSLRERQKLGKTGSGQRPAAGYRPDRFSRG